MPRRNLAGARVLLTGASSGIGRALALRLADRGAELLITARRTDRLEKLAAQLKQQGTSVAFFAADIADPEARVQLVASARERWGELDILINCAGVGAIGPVADSEPEHLRRVMEVNFFAPLELTRAALPLLRRGRDPLVVNIGSVLGHRSVPGKAVYSASKFALHGLTDAWRAELAGDGIEMLLVSPSTTSSDFFDSLLAGQQNSGDRGGASPDWVAERTVRAMERRRHEIILTWGGKLLVYADRLAPTVLDDLLARWYRRHQ